MGTLTERRARVKALGREEVAALLSYAGEEITRDWHFKGDRSFSIRRDGYIKDFGGTGFTGDIVSFLHEQRGYPLVLALQWVERCMGWEVAA